MIDHSAYESIIAVRPLTNPIWKMAITPSEFNTLKECLRQAYKEGKLKDYPNEAAICFAEWWRSEYNGGPIAEKEVAKSIGLPESAVQLLYLTAKHALEIWKVPVIRHNYTLTFRTLLLQGGLPMRHVIGNLNVFTRFLKGLISELSQISVDWEDTSIIPQLDCSLYLSKSFKNDDIYSLSLQIARAIIEERVDLLPYDSNSVELQQLTQTLQSEWVRTKNTVRRKPLSFKWELSLKESEGNAVGHFRYSLESVRNLYASSLDGFSGDDCYQFDLYVSQRYVATYKKVSSDNEESVYRRMNTDNVIFEWKGEPFIEVKMICDNEKTHFITVLGCYPPDFSNPQLFQKSDRVYVQQRHFCSEENIVIFSSEWSVSDPTTKGIFIGEEKYYFLSFLDSVSLKNNVTGENRTIQNKYTSYSVEFKGTFIEWLESSNFILLNKLPYIVVYDENDNMVRTVIHSYYRKKSDNAWTRISKYTTLPAGLIEIKVDLPDGQSLVKTFYSITDLRFYTRNEETFSGIIECHCTWGNAHPKLQEGIVFSDLQYHKWKVTRPEDNNYPATCSFSILSNNCKSLEISIPSPFRGTCLVDEKGRIVKGGKTLSLSNLLNYKIVQQGVSKQKLSFSYTEKGIKSDYVTLPGLVSKGITPLSNFEDIITRLFDLYGADHFDRSNAVTMTVNRETYYIRAFTMDTEMTPQHFIRVVSLKMRPLSYPYEGRLLACPAIDPNQDTAIETVELKRINDTEFAFPDNCIGNYIVFSDNYDRDRIVPKSYVVEYPYMEQPEEEHPNIEQQYHRTITLNSLSSLSQLGSPLNLMDQQEEITQRAIKQNESIERWKQALSEDSVSTSDNWGKVVEYMDIAHQYKLPFVFFNTITAAVSTPSLFGRLILRMFLEGKNEQLIGDINKLEREYAIAVHWLRPEDFNLAIDEIFKVVPTIIPILLNGFSELLRDLLSVTIDQESADVVSKYIMGNKETLNPTRLSPEEINLLQSRAYGKTELNKDLPVEYLRLKNNYYGRGPGSSMTPYQTTLIHSPLYVFEYLIKENDSLWSPNHLHLRRTVNYYRRYFMRSYCEVLTKMFR